MFHRHRRRRHGGVCDLCITHCLGCLPPVSTDSAWLQADFADWEVPYALAREAMVRLSQSRPSYRPSPVTAQQACTNLQEGAEQGTGEAGVRECKEQIATNLVTGTVHQACWPSQLCQPKLPGCVNQTI